METITRLYEGMFVLPQTLVRQDKDKAFDLIKSVLTKYDAKVEYIEIWDERALAYEMNHVRDATYVLAYFNAEASVISKIERTIRITDDILRALILRPEANFDLAELKKVNDESVENKDSEGKKVEVKV